MPTAAGARDARREPGRPFDRIGDSVGLLREAVVVEQRFGMPCHVDGRTSFLPMPGDDEDCHRPSADDDRCLEDRRPCGPTIPRPAWHRVHGGTWTAAVRDEQRRPSGAPVGAVCELSMDRTCSRDIPIAPSPHVMMRDHASAPRRTGKVVVDGVGHVGGRRVPSAITSPVGSADSSTPLRSAAAATPTRALPRGVHLSVGPHDPGGRGRHGSAGRSSSPRII